MICPQPNHCEVDGHGKRTIYQVIVKLFELTFDTVIVEDIIYSDILNYTKLAFNSLKLFKMTQFLSQSNKGLSAYKQVFFDTLSPSDCVCVCVNACVHARLRACVWDDMLSADLYVFIIIRL